MLLECIHSTQEVDLTCFTEGSCKSWWTIAGKAVYAIRTRASVLTGMWGALVNICTNTQKKRLQALHTGHVAIVINVQGNTHIKNSYKGRLRFINVCVLGLLSLYYLSGIYGQWSQPGMSRWMKDFLWCSHQCNGRHSDRASGVDRLMLNERKNICQYCKLYCMLNCIFWFFVSLQSQPKIILFIYIFIYSISMSYFTWVIAAAHLHLSIVNAKDPAPRIPHVCGSLHLCYIISPGPRNVEIAPSITGIKTCLGKEHRGGTVPSDRSTFPVK